MATIDHKGSYSIGSIVGYESYGGTLYGYKLAKEVYISEAGGYYWVANHGSVTDNKFVYDPTDLNLLSEKDIKESYPKVWTPDPEFKKGDILVGKDGEKTMLFVYVSDDQIERLTPRSDLSSNLGEFGYSTLGDYAGKFGPLKVHTIQSHLSTGKKFSEL